MRMKVVVTVRGTLSFPIDMLRYDCMQPYSEPDAHLIQESMEPYRERGKQYEVKVSRYFNTEREARAWKPTTGRWASFCWAVVKVETEF